jgi:hypothetical protein
MSKWTSSCEQEGILRNIPCHIMEYSQYICLPCGNNIWCGKIFHALSWKKFTMSHVRYCGINNDLLTLNMDLTNIVINNNIIWSFEVKREYKDPFYHSRCNQCSKYLGLLYNTFNIFRTIEMTRNYMLEKLLMNFNQ